MVRPHLGSGLAPSLDSQLERPCSMSAAISISRASVVDGDGMEPANLIRLDKGWAVVFTWSPEDTTLLVPGGEWELGVVGRPVGRSGAPPVEQKPGRVPMQPGREAYMGAYRRPGRWASAPPCDPVDY